MEAPVCLAKGVDLMALKIREIAAEHSVPIVENPPLARALHATVEIDEEIPTEHYKAVAEVIGYVMKLRRAAGRRMISGIPSPFRGWNRNGGRNPRNPCANRPWLRHQGAASLRRVEFPGPSIKPAWQAGPERNLPACPRIDRSQSGARGGSIGMVLLVAVALVGAAVGLLLVGRGNASPYILALLALLAMVGVFSLFALATGILRVAGKDGGQPGAQGGGRRGGRRPPGHRSSAAG